MAYSEAEVEAAARALATFYGVPFNGLSIEKFSEAAIASLTAAASVRASAPVTEEEAFAAFKDGYNNGIDPSKVSEVGALNRAGVRAILSLLKSRSVAGAIPERWMPIETAPKDGMIFLAVDRRHDERAYTAYWHNFDSTWRAECKGGGPRKPTDWMPMPGLPNAARPSPTLNRDAPGTPDLADEPRPNPAFPSGENRMVQIAKLIVEMQDIEKRWGNTCIYIRRGGLSWGAVALNYKSDDEKNGVFDLQASHDRDMIQRTEQVERLITERNEWMTRASNRDALLDEVVKAKAPLDRLIFCFEGNPDDKLCFVSIGDLRRLCAALQAVAKNGEG